MIASMMHRAGCWPRIAVVKPVAMQGYQEGAILSSPFMLPWTGCSCQDFSVLSRLEATDDVWPWQITDFFCLENSKDVLMRFGQSTDKDEALHFMI